MAIGRNNKIKGITIKISGDTTELDKALKNVNTSIRNTKTDLRDLDKLLKLDPGNTELLTQKHQKLSEAVEETKKKLETLKEAKKQADERLAKGNIGTDEYDALQREIIETEQNLKSLETQAAESNVELQKVAAAGDKLKSAGDKIAGIGQTLTTHVTLPLTAAGAAGVKSFAEVDKTMSLANKTMNSTTEEAELINAAMKEAAANSTFGMSDAATAVLNFARAGLKAEEASKALAPAMDLAAGEGGDLDTVSQGLVGTINAFHDSFSNAANYTDVFAAACNNSQLDVNSLASSVGNAAPVFATAGYKVEDLTLAMGLMGNANIDASQASNALKSGIMRLVAPAKSGAEALESLGFSTADASEYAEKLEAAEYKLEEKQASLTAKQIKYNEAVGKYGENSSQAANANASLVKATNEYEKAQKEVNTIMQEAMQNTEGFGNLMVDDEGKMRPFTEVLGALHDKFAELSDAEQIDMADKIFGKNRGAAWIALINSSTDSINELNEAIHDSAGTTKDMAETMMSGFGGSLEKLKSSIDVLVTSVGEALAPLISKIADKIQGLVDRFNEMTPAQQEIIVKIGLIVAALGPLLLIVGKTMSGVGSIMTMLPKISGGLKSIVAAIGGISAPVFIIVAIIGVLTAAFIKLWNTNEEFRNKITAIWDGIRKKFEDFANGIIERLNALGFDFGSFGEVVKAVWDKLCSILAPMFEGAFHQVGVILSSALDFIMGLLDVFIGLFTGDWKRFWDGIKEIFFAVINLIKGTFESWSIAIGGIIGKTKDTIINGIQKAIDWIKSLPSQAAAWGRDFIQGLIDGIKEKVSGVVDAVKEVGEKIKEYLHFSQPDEGPLRDYEKWMPDFMRGLADGIRNNQYLVTDALKDLTSNMNINATLANGTGDKTQALLESYLPQIMAGQAIVLDTGELVGHTVQRYSQAMGHLYFRENNI